MPPEPSWSRSTPICSRPVFLIYGDSHKCKITRPLLQKAPNIFVLQVFGVKQMHAVKVTVDMKKPEVFDIEPIRNEVLAN